MPTFSAAPVKPPVSIGDVERVDIRVGGILSAEEVPGRTSSSG